MDPGGRKAAAARPALSRDEREGIVEHHSLGKELLAGFAAAEVDKHFDSGRYGHLDREQARLQARQQADYLWQERHGRY